jgi:hypothetical protein
MLFLPYKIKNLLKNLFLDLKGQAWLLQVLVESIEHFLLSRLDHGDGGVELDHCPEVLEGCLDVLLQRLVGDLLEHEVHIVEGGNLLVLEEVPELLPDASSHQVVINLEQVLLQIGKGVGVVPYFGVGVLARVENQSFDRDNGRFIESHRGQS